MNIIQYEKKFGEIGFPEGFEDYIKELPVEKQLKYFRTSSNKRHAAMTYDARKKRPGYKQIENNSKIEGIIVKDGMMVGIMIRDAWGRIMPCTPEECICTSYTLEDSEKREYTWLLCVSANFEK